MIGDLQLYKIEVSPRLSRGTRPGTDGRQHCYEICAYYVLSHAESAPNLRLVHGDLSIVGNPYAHSWIEFPDEGYVFEPSNQ